MAAHEMEEAEEVALHLPPATHKHACLQQLEGNDQTHCSNCKTPGPLEPPKPKHREKWANINSY
eukprot:4635914-Amphidinium_carterae.1